VKAIWPRDAPHCRNTFLEITIGGPVSISGGTELGYYGTVRNKNSETNEKGSGEIIWPYTHYIFIAGP